MRGNISGTVLRIQPVIRGDLLLSGGYTLPRGGNISVTFRRIQPVIRADLLLSGGYTLPSVITYWVLSVGYSLSSREICYCQEDTHYREG